MEPLTIAYSQKVDCRTVDDPGSSFALDEGSLSVGSVLGKGPCLTLVQIDSVADLPLGMTARVSDLPG